jgi:hypothetical protein
MAKKVSPKNPSNKKKGSKRTREQDRKSSAVLPGARVVARGATGPTPPAIG